jgi:hypothetical protein
MQLIIYTMPLHAYIRQIYQEINDTAYVVRFIDFIIGRYGMRTEFSIGSNKAIPLITGVLKNVKTKEQYSSLSDFYNQATGETSSPTDINILKSINVTQAYSVWRIICNTKEKDILDFFDQKYRAFLMYREVRRYIRRYSNIDDIKEIDLVWNNISYTLNYTSIECSDGLQQSLELLKEYEDKTINGLFYRLPDGLYTIGKS